MSESKMTVALEALFAPGTLLADRNGDGYPDDLRARIVLDGQPSAGLWCALLDLAARLGLETAGLSLPLVAGEPADDTLPILARDGDATAPEYQPTGWQGRPAVLAAGPAAMRALARLGHVELGDGQPAPAPVDHLDLARLFACDGLLVDADHDGAPDGSRLCVVVPPELPLPVGSALIDLVARLGLESGGIDLPTATTGDVPPGRVPLRLRLTPDEPARLAVHHEDNRPALELSGDPDAAADLIRRLARSWPDVLGSRAVEDALAWLRRSLAGWTPEGRAALLRHDLTGVNDVPADGTVRLLAGDPRERAGLARVVRDAIGPNTPVLGPGASQIVFQHDWSARWEGARLLDTFRERILPGLERGLPVTITAVISEPRAIRQRLARMLREALAGAGFAEPDVTVTVLDAFKVGLCWVREVVLPAWRDLPGLERVVIRFQPLEPDPTLNALDLRIRWLQELFPADEIIAAALGLPLDRVTIEAWGGSAIYALDAFDADDRVVAHQEFSPPWRHRPYLGPYPDAGTVHVVTGGILAQQGERDIAARVPTDLEVFWDYFQGEVLPRLGRAIVEQGDGNPRPAQQPFFDELRIELSASEVDEPFGIREEQCSAAEALHEDIYFNALDFVEELGKRHGGARLSAPGSVVPIVHVRPGMPPHARVSLRARPRAVARCELGALRRPLGVIAQVLPPAARVQAVTLDGDRLRLDLHFADASVPALALLPALAALAPPVDGRPVLAAHDATGAVHTIAAPAPDRLPGVEPAADPTPDGAILTEDNLYPLLARIAGQPGVAVSLAERSFQGRPIPAIELTAPMTAEVWSPRKLSLQKPTILIVARHHANEVASTTAALQLVERLTGDPAWRPLLDRVNVAILPFENPDGAALHAMLQREHPVWKHHPARYNAVGFEFAEHMHEPDSPYGEARVRGRLWRRWLPDVVVDNHGVPSHEWAQVFAGFGSPPRFGISYWQVQALLYGILHYLDDPEYPEHAAAAVALRDAVSEAAAAEPDLLRGNRVYFERYQTWAQRWVPERFPAKRHGEMIWYFGAISSDSGFARRSFAARAPKLTVASWVTEVPDETAHGAYLARTAGAHLTANRATLDLLAAAAAPPVRRRCATPGGERIIVARRRPIRLGPDPE